VPWALQRQLQPRVAVLSLSLSMAGWSHPPPVSACRSSANATAVSLCELLVAKRPQLLLAADTVSIASSRRPADRTEQWSRSSAHSAWSHSAHAREGAAPFG